MKDLTLGCARWWRCVATAVLLFAGPMATDANCQTVGAGSGPVAPALQQGGSQAAPPASEAPGWRRWIDPQVGTIGARYRFIENGRGVTTANQLQHKETLRVRFPIDPKGTAALVLGALTGGNFTGSWNPTGLGTGETTVDFLPRQLFASLMPVRGVEVQVGGLYVHRGDTTEIVGYDNDGYIAGERLSVRMPARLYFDEVVLTTGYMGDTQEPNLFDRTDRLGDWNYVQALVSKRIHPSLAVTAEYAVADDVHQFRSAVVIRSGRMRVVDQVRFEQYTRLDAAAFGFALEGQRALTSRLTAGAGVADIDAFVGALNADRFNRGRRLYAFSSLRLAPDLVLQGWATRAVGRTRSLSNLTRIDVILEYDLLRSLTRAGVLR